MLALSRRARPARRACTPLAFLTPPLTQPTTMTTTTPNSSQSPLPPPQDARARAASISAPPLPSPPRALPPPPPSTLSDIRSCTYNRSTLDRRNNARRDPTFTPALVGPRSRFLLLAPDLSVLTYSAPRTRLVLLSLPALPPSLRALAAHEPPFASLDTTLGPLLVLGVAPPRDPPAENDNDDGNNAAAPASELELELELEPGCPYLALRIPPPLHAELVASWLPSVMPDAAFVHLRAASNDLPPAHSALAAHARSLFEFHAQHLFCGSCGAPTRSEHGGSRRVCMVAAAARSDAPATPTSTQPPQQQQQQQQQPDAPQCSATWFPRSDPVVIMLVTHAKRGVLLARPARYRRKLYSCLAGFMEHAEGVDDAVRREVFEEVGVPIGRVRFFGSQAWPFPYSLMLGCIAEAIADDMRIDENELEHARWFSRDEVREMVRRAHVRVTDGVSDEVDDVYVPPVRAIAGQMLAAFAEADPITSFVDAESSTTRPACKPSSL